jgi:hydroxyacyl-ACP dehydratase HTD2-like protein with hotdog domain
MSVQAYFEDVAEGQVVPSIQKHVTTINIMMYLAAVWLLDRIHYDYLFATKRRGLLNVVEPGNMAVDYYAQMLNEWIGEKGEIRKLSLEYRSFRFPGDILTIGGKVVNKYMIEGKGYVELDLWVNNERGINCAPGKCTVELPFREM